MKDIYEIKKNGEDTWYLKNNIIHRDNDLPARESQNSKVWYKEGLIHRDNDLPAMIGLDEQIWYKEGLIHRDNDLPAVIIRNGQKQMWYKNGVLHRVGKPAIISQAFSYDLAYEEWWNEGKKHREDGPAVTFSNGNKEYWLNGVEIPEKDFLHELEKFKLNKKLNEDLKQSPKKRKIKL